MFTDDWRYYRSASAIAVTKKQTDDDARKLLSEIQTIKNDPDPLDAVSDYGFSLRLDDNQICQTMPDLGARAIEILRKLYPNGWV